MKIWMTLIISCTLFGCTKLGPHLPSDTFKFPSDSYLLGRAEEYCYRKWEGTGFAFLKIDTFRFEITEEGKVPDSAQYRKTTLTKKGKGAFEYIFGSPLLIKQDWEYKWFLFIITYTNNNRPVSIKYWFRLDDPYCFSPY
jgi:hypothetical protein